MAIRPQTIESTEMYTLIFNKYDTYKQLNLTLTARNHLSGRLTKPHAGWSVEGIYLPSTTYWKTNGGIPQFATWGCALYGLHAASSPLTDSRSSIQYLRNWPKIMDSTGLAILSKLARLGQRKQVCLQ
ncbi:hypothetical protein TNCV_693021 [Trichonephila clavipes]|nr:hypothetical protein TNCV_693021 [Trichonephila clavipes]